MALTYRWTEDRERVAQARMLCYITAPNRMEFYRHRTGLELGCRYLLVEREEEIAGTATAYDLAMWVHSHRVACQGVAYVGATKTERRRGGSGQDPSVATIVMKQLLDDARQRGQSVSALVPFRASFYEHFGYGTVERRNQWTIPTGLLPRAGHSYRMLRGEDQEQRSAARQRMAERCHCDIERTDGLWAKLAAGSGEGFTVVDAGEGGRIRGSLSLLTGRHRDRDLLKVDDWIAEDTAALIRHLHYLSSLRDQFAYVSIDLPRDLPVNWLLSESGFEAQRLNHDTAELHPYERLQIRVLDHAKFLEGQRLPASVSGRVGVAIAEPEGGESRVRIDIDRGAVSAAAGPADAEVRCPARVWSAVATGHVTASTAHALGLLACDEPAALEVLDGFARGPAAFCQERF